MIAKTWIVLAGSDEGRKYLLCFANDEEIDEIGEWFRVERNTDATSNDEWVTALSLGTAQGNACERENGEDIEMIVLKGKRECNDIKITEGAEGFTTYQFAT